MTRVLLRPSKTMQACLAATCTQCCAYDGFDIISGRGIVGRSGNVQKDVNLFMYTEYARLLLLLPLLLLLLVMLLTSMHAQAFPRCK